MSKKIVPLLSNVLVEQLSKEEVTQSGIILPDFDREKRRDFKYGIVLAVGDGYNSEALHQASAEAAFLDARKGDGKESYNHESSATPFPRALPIQVKRGDLVMMNSFGLERTGTQGKEYFLVGKVHVSAKMDEIDCPVCAGESMPNLADPADHLGLVRRQWLDGLCTNHLAENLKRERSTAKVA